ncbi:MAG: hypothetical protein P4L51_10940 [Puia sp.]|nr:hypothetical protein [Puia sp.]
MKGKTLLYNIIRCVFFFLFAYSGITKLLNFTEFRRQMGEIFNSGFLMECVIYLVPSVELLVAAFLIIKPFRMKAFQLGFVTMILFTIYIILLTFLSHDVPCSCGGFLERIPTGIHIIFNISFAALALVGIQLEKKCNDKMDKIVNNFTYKNLAQDLPSCPDQAEVLQATYQSGLLNQEKPKTCRKE